MNSSFYTNVLRFGSNILYRGIRDGFPVQTKTKFKPTLFVPTDKESDWKTLLDNRNAEKIEFSDISKARDFLNQYKEVDNFEVHGNPDFAVQYIQQRWPNEIDFDFSKINITNIDIETDSSESFADPDIADKEIISIALKNTRSDRIYVWGMKYYDVKQSPYRDIIDYRQFDNETDMLYDFLKFWESDYPDIVIGWNVDKYDIKYIVNRFKLIFPEEVYKRLSPWNVVNFKEKWVRMNGHNIKVGVYDLLGITVFDYIELFKKFDKTYGPQESYSLNHISHTVLGEKKLSYEEFGSLGNLYTEDFQKFINYNILDILLVERIDQQCGILELAITMAYKAGCNYEDVLGTTRLWTTIAYRFMYNQKICLPPKKEGSNESYPGAYVKDPIAGMHDWICSFDMKSLYPNIIVQYNISPETYIPGKFNSKANVESCLDGTCYNDDPRYSMSASGHYFTNEKRGILPEIIIALYNERVETQSEARELKQEKQKLEQELKTLEDM